MGANATTFVPTYVASEVLTAADLNVTNSGVPVFADTTARDNAFGGAGEKVLAEGQLCYLESTNVVQYYDGAVWATVGPQTLSSGLNFITGTTFSAVSSVSLPNGTFTSTYANYRVIIFLTANTTDETAFTLRMRASGTDDATGYYGAFYGVNAVADTLRVLRSNNATGFALGTLRTGTVDQGFSFDVLNPQIANNTTWIGGATGYLAAANDYGAFSFAGAELSTTQFDALSFFPAAGTITGTYRVYGYSDS